MKKGLWLCLIILVTAIFLVFPIQASASAEHNITDIINISAGSFWDEFPPYLWLVFGIVGGILVMLVIYLVFTSPKRKRILTGVKTGKTGNPPTAVPAQPIPSQTTPGQPVPSQPIPAQTAPGEPILLQPAQASPKPVTDKTAPQPAGTESPSPGPSQAQPVPHPMPVQTADTKPEPPQPDQEQPAPRSMPPKTTDAAPVPAQPTGPQPTPASTPIQTPDVKPEPPQPAQEQQTTPRTMPPQSDQAQAQPIPRSIPPAQAATARPAPAQPVQAQPVPGPRPAQAAAARPVPAQTAQAQPVPGPRPAQPAAARPIPAQSGGVRPMPGPRPAQTPTVRPVPGQPVRPQPVSPNVVSLQPQAVKTAIFSARNLNITPRQVKNGDPINISATVMNTGTASGEHSMELRIGGEVESVLKVSLDPGSSEIVNSTVTKDKPGNYTVELDRLRGGFTVIQRRPASFSVSNLIISPEKVNQGESVAISAIVTNSGETEGTYSLVLRIKGITESVEDVTLPPGGNERITFNITKDAAGFYPLSIDHLSGRFVVEMDWTG